MGMTEVAGWMAAAAGLTAISGVIAAMRREPAERRFSLIRSSIGSFCAATGITTLMRTLSPRGSRPLSTPS